MKRTVLVFAAVAVALAGLLSAFGAGGEKSPAPELKTLGSKVSYMLGLQTGESLKNAYREVDLDVFFRGLKDGLEGQKPLLSAEQRTEAMQEFARKRQEEMDALAETNQKAGEEFFNKNKQKKGILTTESGLQYEVLEKGDGPKPKLTDWVTVYYRGTLIDGTEFDKTLRPDEPVKFALNRVIPGWTEGLQLMNVGGKLRLFIPANLAYGKRPPPGSPIGPNSTLIFEIELAGIEDAPKGQMALPSSQP